VETIIIAGPQRIDLVTGRVVERFHPEALLAQLTQLEFRRGVQSPQREVVGAVVEERPSPTLRGRRIDAPVAARELAAETQRARAIESRAKRPVPLELGDGVTEGKNVQGMGGEKEPAPIGEQHPFHFAQDRLAPLEIDVIDPVVREEHQFEMPRRKRREVTGIADDEARSRWRLVWEQLPAAIDHPRRVVQPDVGAGNRGEGVTRPPGSHAQVQHLNLVPAPLVHPEQPLLGREQLVVLICVYVAIVYPLVLFHHLTVFSLFEDYITRHTPQ
jgi:hypothetical protein